MRLHFFCNSGQMGWFRNFRWVRSPQSVQGQSTGGRSESQQEGGRQGGEGHLVWGGGYGIWQVCVIRLSVHGRSQFSGCCLQVIAGWKVAGRVGGYQLGNSRRLGRGRKGPPVTRLRSRQAPQSPGAPSHQGSAVARGPQLLGPWSPGAPGLQVSSVVLWLPGSPVARVSRSPGAPMVTMVPWLPGFCGRQGPPVTRVLWLPGFRRCQGPPVARGPRLPGPPVTRVPRSLGSPVARSGRQLGPR